MDNYYYHQQNILNKIKTNYKGLKKELTQFYEEKYKPFHLQQLENQTIPHRVLLLNNYYTAAEAFENQFKITSQSKFRSSILEEFNVYLFKDLPEIKELNLDFFNKGIYAGLKLDHNGQIAVITKDVDFCIGKRFVLTLEQHELEIIIPLVAVEVKTYLDATMYNEVQFSMQTIKNATPNVRTYLLMERNEVKADKIIASKTESPLDEIFVLRGTKEQPIDEDTVYDYYLEILAALRTNLDVELKVPGRLFKSTPNTLAPKHSTAAFAKVLQKH